MWHMCIGTVMEWSADVPTFCLVVDTRIVSHFNLCCLAVKPELFNSPHVKPSTCVLLGEHVTVWGPCTFRCYLTPFSWVASQIYMLGDLSTFLYHALLTSFLDGSWNVISKVCFIQWLVMFSSFLEGSPILGFCFSYCSIILHLALRCSSHPQLITTRQARCTRNLILKLTAGIPSSTIYMPTPSTAWKYFTWQFRRACACIFVFFSFFETLHLCFRRTGPLISFLGMRDLAVHVKGAPRQLCPL